MHFFSMAVRVPQFIFVKLLRTPPSRSIETGGNL